MKLKLKLLIKILLITLLIFIVIGFIYTNIGYDINYYVIDSDKVHTQFKICHISDYHNKKLDNKLINDIKKEEPNIIAITGDLIDSGNTKEGLEFIKFIKDIAPIYYVTGNHEADDIDVFFKFEQELDKLGVNILRDENVVINNINIIGLDDPMFTNKDCLTKFKDNNLFKLVLTHRPERFNYYLENNSDLVLAGHAHGGLFKIPFVGGLIAPNQGFFPKYYEGLYEKNNTKMIVSKGLGNSVVPFRFLNKAELIFITIK